MLAEHVAGTSPRRPLPANDRDQTAFSNLWAGRLEIQLRTPWQQEWATLVENLDGTYRLTLKDEAGAAEILDYLRLLADTSTRGTL